VGGLLLPRFLPGARTGYCCNSASSSISICISSPSSSCPIPCASSSASSSSPCSPSCSESEFHVDTMSSIRLVVFFVRFDWRVGAGAGTGAGTGAAEAEGGTLESKRRGMVGTDGNKDGSISSPTPLLLLVSIANG